MDTQKLDRIVERLGTKTIRHITEGERLITLTVSPDSVIEYSGRISIQLQAYLDAKNFKCSVRQWTGVGRTGVIQVTTDTE